MHTKLRDKINKNFLSDVADFLFEPVIFEPSSGSINVTLRPINDLVPEPRGQYDIFIESVQIDGDREGPQPMMSGSIPVQVTDNDCE